MWQAIRQFLEAALGALLAFVTGGLKRDNDALNHQLEKLDQAARAAGRVDLLTADEVVRDLQERQLYRLPPPNAPAVTARA